MFKYFNIATFIMAILMQTAIFSQDRENSHGQKEITPMEKWVGMNCPDSTMESKIINDLLKHASEAEIWFVDMIEKGPTENQLDLIKTEYEYLFTLRKEFFSDSSRTITIDVEGETQNILSYQAKQHDEYIEAKLAAFRLRLTFRCLQGLLLLNTNDSREYLLQKSLDTNFIYYDFIQELLNSE